MPETPPTQTRDEPVTDGFGKLPSLLAGRARCDRVTRRDRRDRLSAYEQWDRSLSDALAREFMRGMATLDTGETIEGLRQFAAGERQHARIGYAG